MTNIMTDISGNNHDGTIYGPLSTLDGMAFDGVDDHISIGRPILPDYGDFLLQVTFTFLRSAPGADGDTLFSQYSAIGLDASLGRTLLLTQKTTDKLGFFIGGSSTFASIFILSVNSLVIGQTYTAQATRTGNTYKFFLDGVEQGSVTDTGTRIIQQVPVQLGVRGIVGTFAFYGKFNILGFNIRYGAYTDQQIKDYHNAYASQIALHEDFRYLPCSGEVVHPLGRTPGTGTFKGIENAGLYGDSKALKSVSAGNINKQYKFTQGAIEFDTYQAPGNTSGSNFIFLTEKSDNSFESTININFNLANSIKTIQFSSSGVLSILGDTGVGYFEDGVWYRCRLELHNKDNFTLYIKGGSFGNNFVKVFDFTKTIDIDTKYLSFNDGGTNGHAVANIKAYKGIVVE